MDTSEQEFVLEAYLQKLKDTINSELQILFVKAGFVAFEIHLMTNLDQLRDNRVTYAIKVKGVTKDELLADADKAKRPDPDPRRIKNVRDRRRTRPL
jgi:hypothetical protein